MLKFLRRKLDPGVAETLHLYLKTQYWPLEQQREYQWDKLTRLLEHASRNVPYYAGVFERLGIAAGSIRHPEDLQELPVLGKVEIQENFASLLSLSCDPSRLELNSTGGSTGMPLNFYQDLNYKRHADAARLRAWRDHPSLEDNCIEAVFWGAMRDIGQGLSLKKVLYHVLREGKLPLNTFDLDHALLRRYLRYYNLFSPDVIRGYASSLAYIADFIEEHEIRVHQPRAIISSTEVLHDRVRQNIQRAFGAPIFDSYGCREVSQIATECGAHCGLHICMENQYVELVGNEIIVTNLNNYAMPFIRYRVGDLAQCIDERPCACGRPSPRILKLLGRDNDNIELRNGKIINGEFFEFLFFGLSSVIQYQVVYHKVEGKLTFKLMLRDQKETVANAVRKQLSDTFHFDNIEILYTDSFDRTPSGKLRFVYSVD